MHSIRTKPGRQAGVLLATAILSAALAIASASASSGDAAATSFQAGAAQRQLLGAAYAAGLAVRAACKAEDDGSVCKGSGAAANVYSVNKLVPYIGDTSGNSPYSQGALATCQAAGAVVGKALAVLDLNVSSGSDLSGSPLAADAGAASFACSRNCSLRAFPHGNFWNINWAWVAPAVGQQYTGAGALYDGGLASPPQPGARRAAFTVAAASYGGVYGGYPSAYGDLAFRWGVLCAGCGTPFCGACTAAGACTQCAPGHTLNRGTCFPNLCGGSGCGGVMGK